MKLSFQFSGLNVNMFKRYPSETEVLNTKEMSQGWNDLHAVEWSFNKLTQTLGF